MAPSSLASRGNNHGGAAGLEDGTCCVRVFRSALKTIFSQASAEGSCTCFRARSPTQMSSSRLQGRCSSISVLRNITWLPKLV